MGTVIDLSRFNRYGRYMNGDHSQDAHRIYTPAQLNTACSLVGLDKFLDPMETTAFTAARTHLRNSWIESILTNESLSADDKNYWQQSLGLEKVEIEIDDSEGRMEIRHHVRCGHDSAAQLRQTGPHAFMVDELRLGPYLFQGRADITTCRLGRFFSLVQKVTDRQHSWQDALSRGTMLHDKLCLRHLRL